MDFKGAILRGGRVESRGHFRVKKKGEKGEVVVSPRYFSSVEGKKREKNRDGGDERDGGVYY